MRADRPVCFRLPATAAPLPPAAPIRLGLADGQAAALGELLQVLACGEESAALAFAALAGRSAAAASEALSQIAADERAHDRWLQRLRQATPEPVRDQPLRLALLRFFHGLCAESAGLHFANIVALDSAVCVILGALLARGRPLARDADAACLLARIRSDESRHVRLARELTRALATPGQAVSAARTTRAGLVDVLMRRAAAFDMLEVDPDQLFQRLARVSPGLVS
jgi:hypothetical protein